MSLGKLYCDSEHPAGFESAAKTVKASRNKRKVLMNGCPDRTHTVHSKQICIVYGLLAVFLQ